MDFLRHKRIVSIFLIFILVFMLLSVHLLNIQLVRGDNYALEALEQNTEKVVLEDISRGQILDRNLRSLTGGGSNYRVVVFPELITNKPLVAKELSQILGVKTEEIIHYLNGLPCYLPYSLTHEQIKKLNKYSRPGITLQLVKFRYGNYPLANHLIGHLGKIPSQEYLQKLNSQGDKSYKISDLVGKMGLEKYYDYELKSKYPQRSVRIPRDAHGNLIQSSKPIIDVNNYNSDQCDLVLTIDKDIQRIVEQVMDVRVKKGAVVVMDVATGEIVAMASRPNFHPGHIEDYLSEEEKVFLNRAVALYQPGSIFKVLVAVAALEEGIVDENTILTCSGEKDKLVRCWYYAGHGQIDFYKAFAESCNPAFAQLGLKLGAEKIISYAHRFGLDNQEIIGYPVPSDKRQNLDLIAKKYNLVNSSIGQGPVLTTPVQLTTLLNTIANDGFYKKPVLVKEVRKNGKIIKTFSENNPGKRVVSEETAQVIQELLRLVTSEGVGTEAYVQGFGSAGKTGSAQTGDQGETVNAWFSGFSPSDNPKYVATVLVEESISGGESAAPVFRQLMERILSLNK
ncbi:peptidoglycan D,D-transpeptidase FtsI family protein [Desulfolucanica intricata]|uniref:peptidoglycan D,D-transpeptidase FtsI family protein n=1 Tax=Desulfolucanica intricata TaxID=1285191 RepID=UPI00082D41A1|nr:penicillin-binding transpeptidase domain-containing protein [Desulfolucanica intricata]